MNYFKNILLLSFFLVLFMTTAYEAKTQAPECPDLWPEKIERIQVDGCWYIVQVCFRCSPIENTAILRVTSFYLDPAQPTCTSTWSTDEILDDIYGQLNNPSYIESLCEYGIKPCDGSDGDTYFEMFRTICWNKINEGGTIIYSGCWDGHVYCHTVYKWCFDPQLGYIYEVYYQGISGNYTCDDPEPPDPADGDGWTSCFGVDTPCSP